MLPYVFLYPTLNCFVVEMCYVSKLAFLCLKLLDYFPKLSRNPSFDFTVWFLCCQKKELVKPQASVHVCAQFGCWHCPHHSGVHLIRPHSRCDRYIHAVSGCTSHRYTWTPAARGRWAESDLRHLKHMQTDSLLSLCRMSVGKINSQKHHKGQYNNNTMSINSQNICIQTIKINYQPKMLSFHISSCLIL